MFYAAIALLATRDLSSSRHSGIISLFYKHFVRSDIFPAELAQHLAGRLRCARIRITGISQHLNGPRFARCLKQARAFVQKAEDLVAPRSPHPIRTVKPPAGRHRHAHVYV